MMCPAAGPPRLALSQQHFAAVTHTHTASHVPQNMRSILEYTVSTQHINIVLQQGLIWAGYLVSTSYNSYLLGWYVGDFCEL